MATTHTTHSRAGRLLLCGANALLAGVVLATIHLATPLRAAAEPRSTTPAKAERYAYGWPVKPFFAQHPVRGFFGDPRIGGNGSHNLHFGIDISAPDGTPVYATASGTVVVDARYPEVVSIVRPDGVVFSYWHIVPSVSDGARAVAYRTVLGTIADGWEHVHFAESVDGTNLNPLRPGALGPYRDGTTPAVHLISVERDGEAAGRRFPAGRVDLVAEVRDRTPIAISGKWHGRPIMPALVEWRLAGPRPTSWSVAVDLRASLPRAYDGVYARWTRQNKPWSNGRYRVVLRRGWDASTLTDGRYRIEVRVTDTRGNTATSARRLAVTGHAITLG